MHHKPRFAAPGEVTIERDGPYALIKFKDSDQGVNLGIGPRINAMTDDEILGLYNATVFSQLECADAWRPIEIAEGRPQIKFDRKQRRWLTEGDVLRCKIEGDDIHTEPTIEIDEHKLSLSEFGQLLQPYNGWGMRIVFVSEDQLCDPPPPEVRKAPKRVPKKVLDELVDAEAVREAAKSNVVSFPGRQNAAAPQAGNRTAAPASPDKLRMAEALIMDACEAPTAKQRMALARKALALSEDCQEAYAILAYEEKDCRKRMHLLRQAIKAGERTLGPQWEQEYKGHGWLTLETRPIMRAMTRLAIDLQQEDCFDEALQIYRRLMVLNPHDNQGIRYQLAGCLYEAGLDSELTALLKQFADDPTADLLYVKALQLFRKEGASKRAGQALLAAFNQNPYVPIFLSDIVEMPEDSPVRTGIGDESEAVAYVMDCCYMWDDTEGATKWMAESLAPLLYKRFQNERELVDEVIKELKMDWND